MAAPSLPQEKHTLLIIGSGIAGPTFALTILSHSHLSLLYTPIILDRLPSSLAYFAGAAVVLASNALYPLIQLGLKDAIFQNSEEALRTTLWRGSIPIDTAVEGQAGKYLNTMRDPNWSQDLGTGLRTIERGVLMKTLVDQVIKLGGEVVWNAKVVGYEQTRTGVEVILDDESRRAGHMVIGADGGWSTIRKQLMGGVNWKPEFMNASALYGISRRPAGPDEEIRGQGHVVLLDNGGVSTWALPGGRQFWCVSVLEASQPEEKSTTSADGEYRNITTGGYSLESTEGIMKRLDKLWYPVVGNFGTFFRDSERIVRAPLWQRVYEAPEISNTSNMEGDGNVVLIGDAGRIMLPTSGQGACMSIEDATVLANALLNNPPTLTSQTQKLAFSMALNEYATLRIPRSKSIAKQAYWTGVAFMAERWWWRWIRDFFAGWAPMDKSPKEKAERGEPIKDLSEWLHGVRLEVKLRERDGGISVPQGV